MLNSNYLLFLLNECFIAVEKEGKTLDGKTIIVEVKKPTVI